MSKLKIKVAGVPSYISKYFSWFYDFLHWFYNFFRKKKKKDNFLMIF